eukprot:m.78625 g.78625  ORF g.78625 m.78625 type:complete len:2279 (+) comp12540_c0_seq2:343-7179(+)
MPRRRRQLPVPKGNAKVSLAQFSTVPFVQEQQQERHAPAPAPPHPHTRPQVPDVEMDKPVISMADAIMAEVTHNPAYQPQHFAVNAPTAAKQLEQEAAPIVVDDVTSANALKAAQARSPPNSTANGVHLASAPTQIQHESQAPDTGANGHLDLPSLRVSRASEPFLEENPMLSTDQSSAGAQATPQAAAPQAATPQAATPQQPMSVRSIDLGAPLLEESTIDALFDASPTQQVKAPAPRTQVPPTCSLELAPTHGELIELDYENEANGHMGFDIIGGTDTPYGGSYVSRVAAGTRAQYAGFAVGDRLISVDGISVLETTHAQTASILQSVSHIVQVMVIHIGSEDEWRELCREARSVESRLKRAGIKNRDFLRPINLFELAEDEVPPVRRVTLDKTKTKRLGMFVHGGSDTPLHGCYVSHVTGVGAAFNAGLEANTQILSVNGRSLLTTTRNENVVALKTAGSKIRLLVQNVPKSRQHILFTMSQGAGHHHVNVISLQGHATSGTIATVKLHKQATGIGAHFVGGSDTHQGALYVDMVTDDVQRQLIDLHVGDRVLAFNDKGMLTASVKELHAAIDNVPIGQFVNLTVMHMGQDQWRKVSSDDYMNRTLQLPRRTRQVRSLRIKRSQVAGGHETAGPVFGIFITRPPNVALGACVAGGSDTRLGGVFVTHLQPNSPASQNSQLAVGDRILEAGEQSTICVTQEEAGKILMNLDTNVFLLVQRLGQGKWDALQASLRLSMDKHSKLPNDSVARKDAEWVRKAHREVESRHGTDGLGFTVMGPQAEGGRRANSVESFDRVDSFMNMQRPASIAAAGVRVSKIVPGGVADRDGRLRQFDRLLFINGQDVSDFSFEEVRNVLQQCGGIVELVVSRNKFKIAIRLQRELPGQTSSPNSSQRPSGASSPTSTRSKHFRQTSASSISSLTQKRSLTVSRQDGEFPFSVIGLTKNGHRHMRVPWVFASGVFIRSVAATNDLKQDQDPPQLFHNSAQLPSVGDEIVSVNGVDCTRAPFRLVFDAVSQSKEKVVLEVIPNKDGYAHMENVFEDEERVQELTGSQLTRLSNASAPLRHSHSFLRRQSTGDSTDSEPTDMSPAGRGLNALSLPRQPKVSSVLSPITELPDSLSRPSSQQTRSAGSQELDFSGRTAIRSQSQIQSPLPRAPQSGAKFVLGGMDDEDFEEDEEDDLASDTTVSKPGQPRASSEPPQGETASHTARPPPLSLSQKLAIPRTGSEGELGVSRSSSMHLIAGSMLGESPSTNSFGTPVIPGVYDAFAAHVALSEDDEDDDDREDSRANLRHYEARDGVYPGAPVDVRATPFSACRWEEADPDYLPIQYTSPKVISHVRADPDLPLDQPQTAIEFNTVDSQGVDRSTFLGGRYNLSQNNFPLNPEGRTGICGRGMFVLWGPNHAVHTLITRWARDEAGNVIRAENDRPVLQALCLRNTKEKVVFLPSVFVRPRESLQTAVDRALQLAARGKDGTDTNETSALTALAGIDALGEKHSKAARTGRKIISKVLSDETNISRSEVFRGQLKDARNTDNAWIETVAFNFHDEAGCLKDMNFAGGDEVPLQWVNLTSRCDIASEQFFIIKQTTTSHHAYFVPQRVRRFSSVQTHQVVLHRETHQPFGIRFGTTTDHKHVIVGIRPQSLAMKARLCEADVLTEVNGKDVSKWTHGELRKYMSDHAVIKLSVQRKQASRQPRRSSASQDSTALRAAATAAASSAKAAPTASASGPTVQSTNAVTAKANGSSSSVLGRLQLPAARGGASSAGSDITCIERNGTCFFNVVLTRTSFVNSFGFCVEQGDDGNYFVSRVAANSDAGTLMEVGDEVLSINGIRTRGQNLQMLYSIVVGALSIDLSLMRDKEHMPALGASTSLTSSRLSESRLSKRRHRRNSLGKSLAEKVEIKNVKLEVGVFRGKFDAVQTRGGAVIVTRVSQNSKVLLKLHQGDRILGMCVGTDKFNGDTLTLQKMDEVLRREKSKSQITITLTRRMATNAATRMFPAQFAGGASPHVTLSSEPGESFPLKGLLDRVGEATDLASRLHMYSTEHCPDDCSMSTVIVSRPHGSHSQAFGFGVADMYENETRLHRLLVVSPVEELQTGQRVIAVRNHSDPKWIFVESATLAELHTAMQGLRVAIEVLVTDHAFSMEHMTRINFMSASRLGSKGHRLWASLGRHGHGRSRHGSETDLHSLTSSTVVTPALTPGDMSPKFFSSATTDEEQHSDSGSTSEGPMGCVLSPVSPDTDTRDNSPVAASPAPTASSAATKPSQQLPLSISPSGEVMV